MLLLICPVKVSDIRHTGYIRDILKVRDEVPMFPGNSAVIFQGGGLPLKALTSNEINNKIRKMKNIIFAISAAAPAIPVKPSNPAIIAMIKKVKAQ